MTDTLRTTTVDHQTIEDDDADFAEVPPKRRVPTITKVLLVGILVAAGFSGGVLIQKNVGASPASASTGLPNFAGGLPAGFPTGAGRNQGSTAATGSGPVVVGTIVSVSGNDVTVKDLGGTTHVVHVSATTGLATTGVDWSTLEPGATVSVNGTKADDGSVTATTVTQR